MESDDLPQTASAAVMTTSLFPGANVDIKALPSQHRTGVYEELPPPSVMEGVFLHELLLVKV